jgi:nicotinamidase-related amidase
MGGTGSKVLLTEYEQLLAAKEVSVVQGIQPLNAKDVLVVVDMQYDFLPGGSFGVAEGNACCAGIVALIQETVKRGGLVVATRDYHPKRHCSFAAQGGHYPPHCIQGDQGSFFEDSIGKALFAARKTNPDQVKIVFKGFHPDVDSYGAFTYTDDIAGNERICRKNGCCLTWTGSFELECSNDEKDINAPPDVMAVEGRKSLADLVKGKARVLACGLAMDYCVLDTTLTAAAAGITAVLISDVSRAAHIPGVGKFGSGFLSDPAEVARKIQSSGVVLTTAAACLAELK